MNLDKNYKGIDADLETSLEEYGFVARPITVDYPDEYFVIYKMGENEYGSGHIRVSELDALVNGTEWASDDDINSMLETVGSSKEEWMSLPFESKFNDLISYWGTENVMGTDYYPNDKKWAFEEIGIDESEEDDTFEINSISELYDWEESSEYPYARDMVAYFIFGDRDDNLIDKAIRGVYSKERADESKLSEIMLGYENNWKENMEQLDIDTVEELGDLMDYYAKGGSVKDNLEKELRKLQRELNSSRLGTYREGDDSEEEMARRRERESKLTRFNEVLKTLNEIDKDSFAKGGSVSTSELNDLIEKINASSGSEFSVSGAYGNYELWAKDSNGGDNRIEVGSRKDIKEALIQNRYNKKYTKYAKGGSVSTSELNDLVEKINESSGSEFSISGAYGNYELWAKDSNGGDNRIEVGSRKDIKEALIQNRYNKKYTKYAKGGETTTRTISYEDGGLAGLVDEEQMRDISFKIKVKTMPKEESIILHEVVEIEEYDAVGEKNVNLPKFHLIYGNNSLAIFDAFGVDEVAGLKREDAVEFIENLKKQGKTEKDGSFMAGLTNFSGDQIFMFFNVERLNFKGFANRVLPHEALHLSRYLISLYKNKWMRENLNTPNWWEDKRATFTELNDDNEEFFAETLERTTAIAMDGWFRATGSRCLADGGNIGLFEDGGETDAKKKERILTVANAIFSLNNKKGRIETSFGTKSLDGLISMIENTNYNSEEIADSIFEDNEKKGKIATSWGSKTYSGLLAMIHYSRHGDKYGDKYANGGDIGLFEDGGETDGRTYAIFSGDKKLSSVYLNDLGYSEKYVGYHDEDADKFGMIQVPAPRKLFVFRDNSWLSFKSKEDAINRIEEWKENISKDDRYTDKIKNSLIKSAENLKKNIFPINYAKGGGVEDKDDLEKLWIGYASAILFSENDSDTEEPLDSNYSISDFDKETVKSSKDLIRKFYIENKEAIKESGLDLDTIGNDIWYTRAGHGAGFFDHSLDQDIENKLTNGAKALGEYPTVETYDGKISVRGGRVFDDYAKGGGVEGTELKYFYVKGRNEDAPNSLKDTYSEFYSEEDLLDYLEKWRKNQKVSINSITKVSMNGETKNVTNLYLNDFNIFDYADGGGVDGFKRFDVDFYDDISTNLKTSVELIIRADSLNNAIEDAIKKAYELKKNYIEFYHRGFFLGSINFANSKDFKKGKFYNKFISNDLYADGGDIENEFYIFEGIDHYNSIPLFRVESTSDSDAEYIGEWHTDRNDAEMELRELNGDSFNEDIYSNVDEELIRVSAEEIYNEQGFMNFRNLFLKLADTDERSGDIETANFRRALVKEYQEKQPRIK